MSFPGPENTTAGGCSTAVAWGAGGHRRLRDDPSLVGRGAGARGHLPPTRPRLRLCVAGEPGPQPYRVRLVKGMTIGGVRAGPGALVELSADRLRVAAHLVRTGAGRPADAATRLDVELFMALRALPAVPAASGESASTTHMSFYCRAAAAVAS